MNGAEIILIDEAIINTKRLGIKTWSGYDRIIINKPEARGYIGLIGAYSSLNSLLSY
jgi:hypothetical protein